jgi:hypothetical protein
MDEYLEQYKKMRVLKKRSQKKLLDNSRNQVSGNIMLYE